MGKIHTEKTQTGHFFALDNVRNFLMACQTLGVPKHALFESSAVVGPDYDSRSVVHGILSLAKVATKFGIAPPEIVKIELELDELKKNDKSLLPSPDNKSQASASDKVQKEEESNLDDPIGLKVNEVCAQLGFSAPERVKMGVYRFNENTVAYVRVLRGVPLVRYKDNWEELGNFMLQINPDSLKVGGDSSKPKEGELKDGDKKETAMANNVASPSLMSSLSVSPPTPLGSLLGESATSPLSTASVTSTAGTATTSSTDAETNVSEQQTEEVKRLEVEQITAKKEFFYLTALAVKMNHELREDTCVISTSELYDKAIKEDVPFNMFAEWLEKELTKSYLQINHEDRIRSGSQVNLRERRQRTVSSLQKRHHNQLNFAASGQK